MSIPDELRAAARTLRAAAKETRPGPWRFVPDLYWDRAAIMSDSPDAMGWDALVMDVHSDLEHPAARWAALAHPGLAEPLAAWLEQTADTVPDHQPDPQYAGLPDHQWCTGCRNEECEGLRTIAAARDVARVLNGTEEETSA